MIILLRKLTSILWVGASVLLLPVSGHTQDLKPQHAVEFVVPAGPGAALDTAARQLQKLLAQDGNLDQTVVIVNRPGGSGAVALQSLRAHEGNFHWLSTFTTGMISARALNPNASLSYKEMTPIALLLEESMLVAVRADSPLKTAHDLVTQLKKSPASLTIAIATSAGNHIHIAIAKPLKMAGVDITKLVVVPYKSSGESINALLGGHVDVVSASSPNVLAHYRAGTIRLLAVTTANRLSGELAAIPTWKELGIDAVTNSVQGVLGPKGLSAEQVDYWEKALERITASKEWTDFLDSQLWRPYFVKHKEMEAELEANYVATKALLEDMNLLQP